MLLQQVDPKRCRCRGVEGERRRPRATVPCVPPHRFVRAILSIETESWHIDTRTLRESLTAGVSDELQRVCEGDARVGLGSRVANLQAQAFCQRCGHPHTVRVYRGTVETACVVTSRTSKPAMTAQTVAGS